MPQYIRSYTKGATYFFTLVAYERRPIFCKDDFLKAFKASIKTVQQQYPFEILAWVQLPDHLHCIWQMTDEDTNYSQCWSRIKRLTTRACPQYHLASDDLSTSKVNRNEKGLWQRRFYEHQIHSEEDFINHMNYLHYNPVKHGLVKKVADWPYSSFHRHVKKGNYPADWGAKIIELPEKFADNLE
ncbi:REP-associated tyrosine transposase [Psychrobacter sp. T6-1]|uniref:REP-associated tyrosine transposase n=2 Tax=unclassified Psychrobacter TaxID=196806 RepID=UPI003FD682E4